MVKLPRVCYDLAGKILDEFIKSSLCVFSRPIPGIAFLRFIILDDNILEAVLRLML